MLKNWINPVDIQQYDLDKLKAYQVGAHLQFFGHTRRSLRRCKLALVGLDPEVAHAFRQAFYGLAWHFDKLSFFDLGNVRKAEVDFLIPLLKELLDSDIFPILIGGDTAAVQAQYQAFLEWQKLISLAVVDDQIALSPQESKARRYYLNPAVHARRHPLFHLSMIGPQAHLLDPAVLDLLEERHFETIRLGPARSDMEELEPLLRNADLLVVNMASLKYAEAPAQAGSNPSGFTLEEMNQIGRYAGMSDKLRSCGIYGFSPGDSQRDNDVTAQAMAQLAWYFTDGFHQRKNDFPVTNQGLTEYIVDSKSFERLTFWKSTRSGRWWIQAPAGGKSAYARHRLVPCSYNDYLQACQGELPDRLVNALQRFQ